MSQGNIEMHVILISPLSQLGHPNALAISYITIDAACLDASYIATLVLASSIIIVITS